MPRKFSKNCDLCGKHYVSQGRRFCSVLCRNRVLGKNRRDGENNPFFGKKHSPETIKKKSELQMGNKGSNWQGGKTPINRAIRKRSEYRLWRKAVFERDDYTCQNCGKRGGLLNADHIKPFSLFPDLRFAIDNGKTLCEPCHRKTPTYGGRIKKFAKSL